MANFWEGNSGLWKSAGSLEELLNKTPQRSHFSLLMSAGKALWEKFEQTGMKDRDYLDRAIAVNERAIMKLPTVLSRDEQRDRDTVRQQLLTAVSCRIWKANSLNDINRAITLGNQLIATCALHDHKRQAKLRYELGIGFLLRYRLTNSMDDINRGIETFEKALEIIPSDQADVGRLIFSVGEALHKRFGASNNMNDLNRAIPKLKDAAIRIKPSDPLYARVMIEVGEALHRRTEETGNMDYLYEAIDILEDGLSKMSKSDPNYEEVSKFLKSKEAWRKTWPSFNRQMTELENLVRMLKTQPKSKSGM